VPGAGTQGRGALAGGYFLPAILSSRYVVSTRMTVPTIFPTEARLSEEMQYGWRRA
jgi:hypothetical protein